MKIEMARAIVAAGDTKYGAIFQQLCDWQYRALERLRDDGAISKEGFDRIVAVPAGKSVTDGGKGGPWIGARTLTDAEVIDREVVALYVLREALPAHQKLMGGITFYPFLAPGVVNALAVLRADLRRQLGRFGRLLCATPLGRYIHPRSYALLAVLTVLVDSARQF